MECEQDPWQKLFTFLGCEWNQNVEIGTKTMDFPHKLSAVNYLPKYYIPKDFELNWRDFEYGNIVNNMLSDIYDNKWNERQE